MAGRSAERIRHLTELSLQPYAIIITVHTSTKSYFTKLTAALALRPGSIFRAPAIMPRDCLRTEWPRYVRWRRIAAFASASPSVVCASGLTRRSEEAAQDTLDDAAPKKLEAKLAPPDATEVAAPRAEAESAKDMQPLFVTPCGAGVGAGAPPPTGPGHGVDGYAKYGLGTG